MEVSNPNCDLAPCIEVPLPRSVLELLERICAERSQPPPDAELRRKLASAGEDEALRVLRTIADCKTKIKSLHGFVTYLLRQQPPPPSLSSPSRSPVPENSRPSSSPGTFANSQGANGAQMEALGELEFRKQFLILNYIGRNELQSVTTAEEIRSLKNLSMVQFEKQVWQRFGEKYVDQEDRRIYHDWDSGKTHIYRCHVSPEGSFRFKGPYLEKPKKHLQKVLGDDNVLMVKFAEEEAERFSIGSRDHYYAGYSKICREGILVGLRRYCFFVFKDGGKEEKKKDPTSSPVKCFFIRIHSDACIDQNVSYILSGRTISEARKLFMHAHTVSSVSNYMIRFSLILSNTLSLKIDLSSVNIDIIEDEYCQDESGNPIYRDGKPLIYTDGTGFISEDLALLCPKNLEKWKRINDNNIEIMHNQDGHVENVAEMGHHGTETLEPPMLIQFRMFNKGRAVKGTFLVNKKLEPKTIKIRHSMVKVEPDRKLLINQTSDSLEIVGTRCLQYQPISLHELQLVCIAVSLPIHPKSLSY
ncbi:putative RNA-dependent RNA polymerase 4 [Morus notabilis]|uniref:RNA-dependent RNA polymerase n=1 Tax=Morus notabilis TaxID=981085 RepID=W9QYQ2_9ROSA|nr:putative RNA-dependent RNA polymerase 4 [Morus notabilis]